MKILKLLEARRNPSVNAKHGGIDIIRAAIKQANGDTKYKFVSFTNVLKLGINPSSQFNTPIGIYAYPIDYVGDRINRDPSSISLSSVVPYAGDSKYVQIFSVRGNIIDLHNDFACSKAIREILKGEGLNFDTIFNAIRDHGLRTNGYGNKFWSLTLYLAMSKSGKLGDQKYYPEDKGNGDKVANSTAVAWNGIFRKYGIDGVVDSHDSGIIHSNEPTQAVFFSRQCISHVDTYLNYKQPIVVPDNQKYRTPAGYRKIVSLDSYTKLRKKLFSDFLEHFSSLSESEKNDFLRETRPNVEVFSSINFKEQIESFMNSDEVLKLAAGELVTLNDNNVRFFWDTLAYDIVDLIEPHDDAFDYIPSKLEVFEYLLQKHFKEVSNCFKNRLNSFIAFLL